MNESNFDIYIHDLLREAGVEAEYQYTSITELSEALSTASKAQTGDTGKPDFIAVVEDYVLVIEDKADRDKCVLRDEDGGISQTIEATKNYAVNGAVWYARKILEHGTYTKIFAFGNAGDARHHTLKPVFVDADGVKELAEVETFENFSPANIEKYYRRDVRGETPPEELRRESIGKKARTLHELLRNYGNLSVTEKPLVVSAIILALREKKNGFSIDYLTGDESEDSYDGQKIYDYISKSLTHARVSSDVKKQRILDQFAFIRNRPILNTKREEWKDGRNTRGKTPLKYFVEFIEREVYKDIDTSSEDVIGIFYMEFIKYTGGDAQSLGVVITPKHITELFCDLVDLKADDVILDPCCGTGGFLIAGMHRMLNLAEKESQRKHIRARQIYGTEIRDDMFAMSTTSMILHGDGQSNITCEDFLATTPSETQLLGITVGFMNPPYSQAKNRETANLSELSFTLQLLDSVLPGGRAAVIVPMSAMVGRTKDDKLKKRDILKHHTLEGVISLNKDTFYGVGTVPCIAVFTAGEPHPKDKQAKFINFEDDGWVVKMHAGELVETERAKDRKQYLLDCWRGERTDYPSKFMVETTVEAGDEWLHSFYYYNDELPGDREFEAGVGDYLTFEANMIFHGRGYLFEVRNIGCLSEEPVSLDGVRWGKFAIGDLFKVEGTTTTRPESLIKNGTTPRITCSTANNGLEDTYKNEPTERGNVLTVDSAAVGFTAYHEYDFIATDHVEKLVLREGQMSKHLGLFFVTAISSATNQKYNYGYKFSQDRIRRQTIMLPLTDDNCPDYAFMEKYIRAVEAKLLREYAAHIHNFTKQTSS